jgi:signal transduction histidine kinase
LFLFFPTGQLRSARWRPVAWFLAGSLVLVGIAALVSATLEWSHPFRQSGQSFTGLVTIILLAAILVSVTALIVRFARSSGEERLQLKWFAAAATVVVVGLAATMLNNNSAVASVLSNLAFLCLWVSIGIAVLKYRLYEIDIVISRAVLYGSLAVFVTAVYVGLVAGVGTLVGNRRSALLSALAAAVVAVAFQPLRHRAGRLANRVVYGRRATPYEVLSDFSRRVGGAYSSEDVLPQMARIVAARPVPSRWSSGCGWVDELHAAPRHPARRGRRRVPHRWGRDARPARRRRQRPRRPPGRLLGAISIRMSRAEPLRPAGEHLVTDLASQAGLVLANAGLIEDLRSSRQRLVTAQDEARRRLERNIHDGAQQDLVALAIKLGLAEATLDEDTAETRQILRQLRSDAAGALDNIRDLARGIYPPLLADLGLVAALSAQAGKFTFPVTVQADGIGRSSQDAEAAVYFCCLEALQNTSKYASATEACVTLQAQNGSLRFITSDDGAGYDSRHTPMGSGLRNMADRLAALGGELDIRSAPGGGTTVTGRLPFPSASAGH